MTGSLYDMENISNMWEKKQLILQNRPTRTFNGSWNLWFLNSDTTIFECQLVKCIQVNSSKRQTHTITRSNKPYSCVR